MVRFRVAEAPARGEFLVEAVVPSQGNDAALIAVFNSRGAAEVFAMYMDKLGRVGYHPGRDDLFAQPLVPLAVESLPAQRDPQEDG